jgi:hypothetical protein
MMLIHFPPTAEEIAALAPAGASQAHELYNAAEHAEGDEQAALTALAEHCIHCGQPLPGGVE